MTPSIIGIKLPVDSANAAVIKLVRGYTNESISVIKQHIADNIYVYQCSYIDTVGINTIRKMYKELCKIGIVPTIYEHERLSSIEFLNNLSKSHKENDRQKYD